MPSESEFRGRRRAILSSSVPASQSGHEDSTRPSPIHLTANESSEKDSSTYLHLLQYITTYLLDHDGFKASEAVAVATIPTMATTYEHIGAGTTFEVSRKMISPHVQLVNSCPRRLELKKVHLSTGRGPTSEFDQDRIVVCKRPRIKPSTYGTSCDNTEIARLEAILLEIKALTHPPLLHHRNIVDFLGIAWDREIAEYNPSDLDSADLDRSPSFVPVLLLEHTRHGSLTDFTETKIYSLLSFEKRASLCRDIAEGLNALHKCGIVHGDVKPDNILIFDSYNDNESRTQLSLCAKIADFGFSIQKRSGETQFTLVGRTWPWNDPGWNIKKMTWSQLQKTDVHSYGLVSWHILAKENLGNLFDIDFTDIDMNNKDIRAQVENMKNSHLAFNATNYFAKEDKATRILAERLFAYSLEPNVLFRGTMADIVELWDTWFIGLGCKQYYALDPTKLLKFEPIETLRNSASTREFQNTIDMASLLPRSVKLQVVSTMTIMTGEDGWRNVLFQSFCYIAGWGVQQNLERGKDLIDQASHFALNSSIFQTMFLPPFSKENKDSKEGQAILHFLSVAQIHGSHEATHKLIQYFSTPCGYASMRSIAYRSWKYGIMREPWRPGENAIIQEEDIRLQFSVHDTVFSQLMHTKLHFAVAMGYTEAVGAMLDAHGFDNSLLRLQDYNGDTPLLLALRFGWYNIILRLIEAGSNLLVRNHYKETVFHFLVEFDVPDEKEDLADKLFVLCGTEWATNVCTISSFPREVVLLFREGDEAPLNRVVFRNDLLLARIFMKHHVTPHDGTNSALILAASLHSWEMLEIFWQSFPNLPAWKSGELLIKACFTVCPQRMYFHGTKTSDNVGKCLGFLTEKAAMRPGTPLLVDNVPLLHYALLHSVDEEILQYIISTSTVADINAYGTYTYPSATAIHLAIQSGSSTLVELLIQKGGDALRPVFHSIDNLSISTIYLCAGSPSTTDRIMQLILDVHAERSVPIPASALASAVVSNNFSGAALLIKAGVEIDEPDTAGTTPLGVVLRQSSIDTVARVRFLLEYPPTVGRPAASFIVKPAVNGTVFHSLAVIPSCTPFYDRRVLRNITDYLLDKFDDPAKINSRAKITGITPLHLAAQNNPEVVRKLLNYDGIDITLRSTRDRKTARQYNDASLVSAVPEIVTRLGEHAEKRYRKDQIEVRNLLAAKCGENETPWNNATKVGHIEMGGGKIAHIMLIEKD